MTRIDEFASPEVRPLRRPTFPDDVFIADTATVIGDVEIGSRTGVWYGAVIRAEMAPVRIGSETSIQDNCVVHVDADNPTTVGDRVTVGHGTVLHGCTVEDDTMVGMNATVLNGALIGEGALVAAGALVREGQEIPTRSMAVGVPARVVGDVDDETAEYIRRNAAVYVELALRYIEGGLSNPAHHNR